MDDTQICVLYQMPAVTLLASYVMFRVRLASFHFFTSILHYFYIHYTTYYQMDSLLISEVYLKW